MPLPRPTRPFCLGTIIVACLIHADSLGHASDAENNPANPQALIARAAKEKSPVWVDGDTATFFFRGEAEQVTLLLAGELMELERLPDSDVWTISVRRAGMAKAVFSYCLLPHK